MNEYRKHSQADSLGAPSPPGEYNSLAAHLDEMETSHTMNFYLFVCLSVLSTFISRYFETGWLRKAVQNYV